MKMGMPWRQAEILAGGHRTLWPAVLYYCVWLRWAGSFNDPRQVREDESHPLLFLA